jgi:hypothetical protein
MRFFDSPLLNAGIARMWLNICEATTMDTLRRFFFSVKVQKNPYKRAIWVNTSKACFGCADITKRNFKKHWDRWCR